MELQAYFDELRAREDSNCWYIVKQETDFNKVVGATNLFSNYLESGKGKKVQDYFDEHKDASNGKMNYRVLSNAYNYGILTNKTNKYENATLTSVYDAIAYYQNLDRVQPYYANDQLNIIKQMQLEKLFVSNKYDRAKQRKFRLFPIPIVYKILWELKDKYKVNSVSKAQFITLIATITSYDDINQAIEFIRETTDNEKYNKTLEELKNKFDNRILTAISQLSTINVLKNRISLNDNFIDNIKNKYQIFFDNISSYKDITDDEYENLLTNTIELWDWYKVKDIVLAPHINEQERKKFGYNTIYYGAPGTGKSYKVNELVKRDYSDYSSEKGNDCVFRVTLHPEYTYTDFVGQILPSTDLNGRVYYRFTPNIFTLALKKAYENPTKKIYLILEEMSRANVAAVFGDLFQLLDRKDCTSEYSINNTDIAEFVYHDPTHAITIPSNMAIIGTVNTSDQNVFVMDTAFKRRFDWKYVSTDEGSESDGFIDPLIKIDDENSFHWKVFYQTLNEFIVGEINLNEDKQIGPYFIKFNNTNPDEAHALVRDKLLQYLWEDVNAASYNSNKSLFLDKKELPGFSVVYERFNAGKPVFSSNFREKLGENNDTASEKD